MRCTWAAPPTRISRGWRRRGRHRPKRRAAHAHIERLTCISRGYRAPSAVRVRAIHHVRDSFAQNVDHLAHDPPLSAFVAEVVCTLGATPPQTATSPPRTSTSPPPNGGNCTNRATTRRRHAGRMLLMVQNPHHYPWRDAPTRASRTLTGVMLSHWYGAARRAPINAGRASSMGRILSEALRRGRPSADVLP